MLIYKSTLIIIESMYIESRCCAIRRIPRANELIVKIETAVKANPNGILWSDFTKDLTVGETRILHDTLRQLKRQKKAERYLAKNADGTRSVVIRAFVEPTKGA